MVSLASLNHKLVVERHLESVE